MSSSIHAHLTAAASVMEATAEACVAPAEESAKAIAESLKKGGKLLLCGNGGSAADAQHLAAEFVATLDHNNPRQALAAIALTTDTSFLTAYANDFGFAGVFERQIEALGKKGDVLIGLSTSGNSANVVRGMEAAHARGITTIAMTGGKGGKLAGCADITIAVPSQSTAHIQECHIALGHAITALVENLMAS